MAVMLLKKPLSAELFWGSIKIYLHFFFIIFRDWDGKGCWNSFLWKIKPLYSVYSLPKLLMIWWHKEPGHQQPWHWPSSAGIFRTSTIRVNWVTQLYINLSIFNCITFWLAVKYMHLLLLSLVDCLSNTMDFLWWKNPIAVIMTQWFVKFPYWLFSFIWEDLPPPQCQWHILPQMIDDVLPSWLTHWGWVTHWCNSKQGRHWFI